MTVAQDTAEPAGAPAWPCLRCETVNAFSADECAACGASFLDGVDSQEISLVIPGVGDLTTMSSKKATAVALGAVGVVMLLVLVVGLLLS